MAQPFDFLPSPFPGEPKEQFLSSSKMHGQVYQSFATTYEGRPCHRQPKDGEIPELDVGKVGNGCQVKSYPPSHPPLKEGDLDIPTLYKEATEQNVQIKVDLVPLKKGGEGGIGVGSGAIVGREGDEILVLTDNHVVSASHGQKVFDIQARFGDGQIYDGRVLTRDLKNDSAIVAFKTGVETDKEYHPATFEDGWSELKMGAKYLTTGYPGFTSRLHVSPGQLLAIDHSSKVPASEHLPGEDRNRYLALLYSHTRRGNSGGPTYNALGHVVGNLEMIIGGTTKYSFINPLSRQYVAGLLKQAGADTE
jgi:S1-C subfamily serine protease